MKQPWFLFLTAIALGGCSNGTPVTVTNRSAAPIENVTISGAGFARKIGTVASGQSVSVSVEPAGESSMGLSFRAGSRMLTIPPQGYFEGGGAYQVSVVIGPDLRASVSSNLKH